MENFTAKDISTIIRACNGSGVTSLVCGGLNLTFEPKDTGPDIIQGQDFQVSTFTTGNGNERELLEDREVEDNMELRELELQNMMMDDPVGYENHMRHEDETS